MNNDYISNLSPEINVYKGEGDITQINNISKWTSDLNIAMFFAINYSKNDAKILKGTISKEYVLEQIKNKMPVDFENVKHIDTLNLYSLTNIESKVLDFAQSKLDKYSPLINELYENNNRFDHDKEHTKRVLFLASILCHQLNIGNKKMLDDLFTAISFHDTGRINDDIDDSHGYRAIPIYREYIKPNSKITEFLIKYHCLDDNIAIDYINNKFKPDKVADVKLLYSIIKDADALDRVRFGSEFLNVNYLRNKESLNLAFLAVQLLKLDL